MKHAASKALTVVREILPRLSPACMLDAGTGKPFLIVAGSLRRRRAEVGDIEIVFVPAHGPVQDGLFTREGDLAAAALESLVISGVITPRVNAKGARMWGAQNKLATHCASGIPLDFFSIKAPDFWNYVVCRTGSKEHNVKLAMAAQERGLKWLPYHGGFQVVDLARASRALAREDLYTGRVLRVTSEADAFAFAGLPYREPWER